MLGLAFAVLNVSHTVFFFRTASNLPQNLTPIVVMDCSVGELIN